MTEITQAASSAEVAHQPTAAGDVAARSLLVVIPAFNEEARVGAVVREVRTAVPYAEVLVVDDGSADETAAAAARGGARVLALPVNLGYGGALQAGYKYAVRHGYEVVAQLDADGQHPPRELPRLLEQLERGDADVVIGSRFLDPAGRYRPSRARKLGMSLFARIASFATRQHVTDPTSGYQAMHTHVARFFCTDVYPSDYPDADILILLHRSGFRLCEVPVEMRAPEGTSMHDGHKSLYYVYKMSLSILVTMMRPRRTHR